MARHAKVPMAGFLGAGRLPVAGQPIAPDDQKRGSMIVVYDLAEGDRVMGSMELDPSDVQHVQANPYDPNAASVSRRAGGSFN